ncbi:hypothetical protein [Arthrobacter sp. TMN-50]
MNDKTRLAPEDPFPKDLDSLPDGEVEVLNSKVTRQIDEEYVEDGEPDPETEFRKEELNEELDERDDETDSENDDSSDQKDSAAN